MKITSASKKVLASALSAAMVVAFAPTVAFAADGSTTPDAKSVASIEVGSITKYYESVKTAAAAATAGDTVKLLADYTVTASEAIAVPAGVIIDGQGKTITGADTSTATTEFANKAAVAEYAEAHDGAEYIAEADKDLTGAALTAKKLSAAQVAAGAQGKFYLYTESHADVSVTVVPGSAAKATIVKDLALADVDGAAVTVYDSESNGNAKTYATLTNVKVKTASVTNDADADANVTIDGASTEIETLNTGETTTVSDATIDAINVVYGKTTIKSGAFKTLDVTDTAESEVIVKGGNFKSTRAKVGLTVASSNAKATIDGGTFAYVENNAAAADNFVLNSGTFTLAAKTVDEAVAELGKFKLESGSTIVKNADGTFTVGFGIDAASVTFVEGFAQVDNSKVSATDTRDAAAVAIAAEAGKWTESIANYTAPANLKLKQGETTKTLFGATPSVKLTTSSFDYSSVKDYNSASTAKLQAKKAAAEEIDAALKAAGLTSIVNKTKAELASSLTEAGKIAYNVYGTIEAEYGNVADITDMGTEVVYYIPTAAIKDYAPTNTYSIVFQDGTKIAAQAVSAKLDNASTASNYLTFKTSKTGIYGIGYVDEFKNAQEEADKAKEEAKKAAAELVKAQDKAAAATGKAQVKGATYKIKAKGSKTIKIAKSASGAKVTLKQTSGTKYAKVSGTKVTLKKAAKKGKTYTIKVKAVCGSTTTSAVAFKVVVK